MYIILSNIVSLSYFMNVYYLYLLGVFLYPGKNYDIFLDRMGSVTFGGYDIVPVQEWFNIYRGAQSWVPAGSYA